MKRPYIAVLAIVLSVVACTPTKGNSASDDAGQVPYVNATLDNIEQDELVVIDRFSSKVVYYSPTDGTSRTSKDSDHYFAYLDRTIPHTYFSYGDSVNLDYKIFKLERGQARIVAETPGRLMIPLGSEQGKEQFVGQEFDAEGLPARSAVYELTASYDVREVSELPFVVVDSVLENGALYVTRYIAETDDFSLYSAPIDQLSALTVVREGLDSAALQVLGGEVVADGAFDEQYPASMCALSCDVINDELVLWLELQDNSLTAHATQVGSGETRAIETGSILGFEVNGENLEIYTAQGVKTYPLGELND